MRDYLEFGAKLVWVVYPQTREVIAHYPGGNSAGSAQTLGAEDTLSGGEVLPGFELKVAEIFG